MDFHNRIIARLDGDGAGTRMERYIALARMGIAGFIIFGGEAQEMREIVARLQAEAAMPLIIASDLEQGLAQQVRGGTLLPPAMAMSAAYDKEPDTVRRAYERMAEEARSVGINTVFAPVLDINSNPDNPIIATRSFGEDAESVSAMGEVMVRALESHGVRSCGKHFPGHGDTSVDSHISLPVAGRSIAELEAMEIAPFRRAVNAGVSMMMLGHLSVQAIDDREIMTCSSKVVHYLRGRMGFGGIITTDAMNMGAIGEASEIEAAARAVRAGVDILLHPSEPEVMAGGLGAMGMANDSARLDAFRRGLSPASDGAMGLRPDDGLSMRLARLAITMAGRPSLKRMQVLVTMSDDEGMDMSALVEGLGIKHLRVGKDGDPRVPEGHDVIAAVSSSVRAWKGGTAGWMRRRLEQLRPALIVTLGNPYIAHGMDAPHMRAFWGSRFAQRAAAEAIAGLLGRG